MNGNQQKKILIISYVIQERTGGGMINRRNIDLFREFSDCVSVVYLDPDSQGIPLWRKLKDRLRGLFSGVNGSGLKHLKEKIITERPDLIFVNQSLLGAVCRLAKKTAPKIPVLTFFHNCEAQYYQSMLNTHAWTGATYINRIASRKAERMAMRYSDRLIAMNRRDAEELKHRYGKPVDFLLPTSFVDQGEIPYLLSQDGEPLELLFVGFNFFANVQGLEWFCREVMPRVQCARLTIVGRNMEQERKRFEGENVRVVGSVEDLEPYYAAADMVVSPIFVGSGMKTKTAEALMYARPLLATAEALEGYDVDPQAIGAQCDTAERFIECIDYFSRHKETLTNKSRSAREAFVTQYSQEVLAARFVEFIRQI